MAYEKKTGLVDLEKLEKDSELMSVAAGTAKKTAGNGCIPWNARSYCYNQTKWTQICYGTAPVNPGPDDR